MIHRISSTLPSFKTLDGFKQGLNILLATKSADATSQQTRNRAGKSSLLEIVNFLLGSDSDPSSIFRMPELIEHRFSMDFDLGGVRTRVTRSAGLRTKMLIRQGEGNEELLSHAEWRRRLGDQMFALESLTSGTAKPPTFRSLIPYFIRRNASGGFLLPEAHDQNQQLADQQLALMFLLDLDWGLAREWQQLRELDGDLKKLKSSAKKGLIGQIVGDSGKLRTELAIARKHKSELSASLTGFRVLPEYRELELESDALTRSLNDISNENTLDIALIHELTEALQEELPPKPEDVSAVYAEAGLVLPDLVARRFEEVHSFHASVVRNRNDYLASELQSAERRLDQRTQQQAILDERRATVMSILSEHGALEQFLKLQEELGKLTAQVEHLEQRFELTEQLESTELDFKSRRNSLLARGQRDLRERSAHLDEIILAYENTSKELYSSAGSMEVGFTDNGPNFKFRMQGNRSVGVTKMTIFAFDMMLMRLCAQRGVGPGFLIHDSHLFDGVDGRQIAQALRIGSKLADELGFQYIVTLNDDDAFKERLHGFDLQDFVLPTRLTDAHEDGGLFGMRFG